jgi:UDP-2-acetamido-3-amino-2,3-dideoxy-glucuronate N-acetyltransferase
MSEVMIHPTAMVEDRVSLGPGTKVWDNVHIRHGACLGRDCIVGEKSYIAYDVRIGNYVKINANVYICAMVTVEDFVMISAGTVFTNDKFPRAFPPDMDGLAASEPSEETLATVVRKGATIGANATIGCGIEIGGFAMVGMGSVVTKSVPDFALVFGNPGRVQGYVCVCGPMVGNKDVFLNSDTVKCTRCGRRYVFDGTRVVEAAIEEHKVPVPGAKR